MKKTINLIKKDEYIDQNTASSSKAVISKKYQHEYVEINTYFFPEESMLFIDAASDENALKTYIVQQGRCLNIESGQVLESGDLIVMDHEKEVLNFKMLENTLIYVHSFHHSAYQGFVSNTERLNALLEKIEQKDAYTKGHCNRVFELSQKIALEMNLSSKQLYNLNMASRYHDIGKIYIEEALLNKVGPISEAERLILKGHVLQGEELITAYFGKEIFDIIVLHHERMDGSGYPYGIKGEAIPIEGRILAVCDSFDAMVTDRVYKKGKPIDEALEELIELAGRSLDAMIVEKLVKILKNIKIYLY